MPAEPVPADPGPEDDLAWLDRDPMTAGERAASLDRLCEQDEPPGEEECEDYAPLTAEELAEVRRAAADDLLAVTAAAAGRRGPGQPGSARVFPGESSSRAAGFGPGMALDVLPGCAGLAVAADAACEDDGFAGVSEAELVGLVCAWDRGEAHAAARKLAVIGELGRRNPGPEDAEFTADEIANALGESRARAGELMGTADCLQTHLPGTGAALRDGTVSLGKARIIAAATALLDPAEAAAAEAGVLDRAARLTPGGLRAAIARAVMEAAPGKARERRETAARFARVERWAEDTGNAALMGRELPPDEVLAADQRITAWAGELKAAGLDGGMDELRARAYLDLLLGTDSRPGGNPKTTWCVTVTDEKGHAVGHGCARPEPGSRRTRAGPGPPGRAGFCFTPARRDGPPGGYGTWRLRTPGPGPDLILSLDPLTTDPCDHRYQAPGHDPGVKLRHLSQIRHATCTSPICRRPAAQCDHEHNTPYEAGGRTCLCNTGPKCRHDHRLKQHPKWTVDQLPDGTFTWTTPAGRTYTTEPTRYPV